MRTVAVIQSRMGSSRFPGKSMGILAGKPLLWHIIHRLKKCSTIDLIVVATTTDPRDNPIERLALVQGVDVVRGPENDVLARFIEAAQTYQADLIVRVNGDAPLVDPIIVDRYVKAVVTGDADYCTETPRTTCINDGIDLLSRRALDKLAREARYDPVAVEHVTGYFSVHPGFAKSVEVSFVESEQIQGARVSVDTPADLVFMNTLYNELNASAGEIDVRDVVALLKGKPELMEINEGVYRKAPTERTRLALIRCDGDGTIGFGHVVRCMALADELRERHGYGVVFATRTGGRTADMIIGAGYGLELSPEEANESEWILLLVDRLSPSALIVDVRTDLPRNTLSACREKGAFVAVIDDLSERRLDSDAVFYPPIPQVGSVSWEGGTGQVYSGWDWVVLRRQFQTSRDWIENVPPRILVTLGGSDPMGMTEIVLDALGEMEASFNAIVVIGPGFRSYQKLKALVQHKSNIFIFKENVSDMHELMVSSDMAIAAFGVTAYELAASGVPAIYLCMTPDHAESAKPFVFQKVGVNLGLFEHITKEMIRTSVGDLLKDVSQRKKMWTQCQHTVDGRGASRIANVISDATLSPVGMR